MSQDAKPYVDPVLSNMSQLYRPQGYIAELLFPVVNVARPDAKFAKFPKGAWFRDEAKARPWGGKAARGSYPTTWGTLDCKDWAFGKEVPDKLRKYADVPLNPDLNAVRYTTTKVLIRKEVITAILCRTAANWANAEDAEGGWAAGVGNTFIADVERGIRYVEQTTGFRPNKLMIDGGTMSSLKQETTLLSRIQYTGSADMPAQVTTRMLAGLFGLDEVLIGGGIVSTAEETKAGTEFTAVNIWETNATKGMGLLVYAPQAPSNEEPTAGAHFEATPREVRRYREEAEQRDVIECAEEWDTVIAGNDLAFMFWDTLVN